MGVCTLATLLVASAPKLQPMVGGIAFPLTSLSIVSVVAAGYVLLQDQRRTKANAAARIYQAIVEALPESLNVKGRDGRFLAANPATAHLMRASTPENLLGRTDFDFYPHEVAEKFRRDDETAFAQDEATLIEQRIRFDDGTSKWLSSLKAVLRARSGEVIGLITHNRDVTETKRLKDELLRTQARLDGALAHMADGLALFDREGVLLLCNERYRKLFPLTADLRVPGSNLRDILRAAADRGERAPLSVPMEAWLSEKLSSLLRENEFVARLADGRRLKFQTRPVEGVGSLTVVADVSGQHAAEEKLRTAEAEYRALFENAVIGIYRSSPEGRMLRANPSLVRLNGYETERELIAAVGDIATEWYVDPSRRADFRRILHAEGRVSDFVSEIYRHKTRQRMWITETAWSVKDTAGTVLYYEGTVLDANERKRAEAIVAASEARYRLLADNVADLIAMVDAAGRLQFASPASRDLLAYEPEELIARTFLELVHVSTGSRSRFCSTIGRPSPTPISSSGRFARMAPRCGWRFAPALWRAARVTCSR